MISLEHVSKVFRSPDGQEVVAVDDVSFEVHPGETLCLIGTSGCGKTTTMKLVNRLIEPTEGVVSVGGINVAEQDPIQLRRSMGYVIQKGGLFPHMTVARNVSILCELEGWDHERREQRTNELLTLVNLSPEEHAHRYPRELSGGQRQRVGVARALALDPEIILMDEPFGALDPITRKQLHEEFLQLEQKVQKTIIMVTHDMDEAFLLGKRIALMDKGMIVQIGTEEDFRERPANEFVREFLEHHLNKGADNGQSN